MSYHSDDVPRRSERVVHRSLAYGDAVLLHLDSGQYHGLNQTGSAIWELVDGERDVGAITRALQDDYEAVPDDVVDLVQDFLQALDRRALVAFESRA